MSSPTDRNYDPGDPSPYAPRWVRSVPPPRRTPVGNPLDREGAHASGAEETSALRNEDDDDVIGSESAPPLAAGAPVVHDDSFMVDDFRVPRSLDPGVVPDPWAGRRSRLRRYRLLGMLGRLALAGSAAAIVALLAIGKLSVPGTTGATEQADTSHAVGSRFASPAIKTQDPPIVAQEASEPPQQVPPQQVALADPSAPVPAPPTAAAAPPPVTPPPAPTAATPASPPPVAEPAAAPAPEFNPEELATLLKRGQQLASSGDIAAARLTLRPAAEAHNAQAALALGATYDPVVLRSLGIFGVTPDVAQARGWYEKAKAYGSAEAPRRLEMLAKSTRQ